MSAKSYIGVGGVAKKIRKAYFGVDGTAKKIKKAYMGVGGVAKCIFSGGELAYYGTATPLFHVRDDLAATSVGNYALFNGGGYREGFTMYVDAYNTSLTKTTVSGGLNSYYLAATSIGNYALFGGGSKGSSVYSTVYAYDASLTRTTPTSLSTARTELSATTVGNYALFGGGAGKPGTDQSTSNRVDAYDTSLTRTTATPFSISRFRLAATSIGNYALFGGGYHVYHPLYDPPIYEILATVEAYDTSLTKTTQTSLSVARHYLSATSVGNYALFGGGTDMSSINRYTTVDAYDTSLTRTDAPSLSSAGTSYATSLDDYALFRNAASGIDVYDSSLTKSTQSALSQPRGGLAATSVGNYALFGGGSYSRGETIVYTDLVDVYMVS